MRRTSVLRARCGRAAVLSTLAIMATTLVMGAPVTGAAVSPTMPWQTMTTPGLLGPNEAFTDVSCPTATFCAAVGYSTAIGTNTNAVADVWKGSGSWKTTTLPAPKLYKGTTRETRFTAVSCSSPTYCMAVGWGTLPWLSELWNGTKWSLAPAPTLAPGEQTLLSSVSCVSTDCVALFGDSAATWNGSSWSIDSNNVLAGTGDISCFAVNQCLAVGLSGNNKSVGAYFDAGTLTDEPPPQNPAPFGYNALNGVSCAAATTSATCMAVGYANGPNPNPPLAEVWDEATGNWTATGPVSSSGQQPTFQDVSCPTVSSCVAVGPTTEALNGTEWTLMNIGNLVSDSSPYTLNGVSCPSTTFCVAVGVKRTSNTAVRAAAAYWGTLP
jgi:hypothetical protein